LNVYTPAKNTSNRLPVMVFLHGGNNLQGAGSDYDGNALAQQGVVVVTTNYRLGPLGWLAHPLLSQESQNKVSGNYGLLDQVASLQWVKTNIAAFGGDPGNVTVIGQSAGAGATISIMASPLTKGLFHRAIVMSAGGIYTPLKEAETRGESFAAQLGVSSAPDVLKALRAKSADELVAASSVAPSTPLMGLSSSEGNFQAWAVVDGWFLLDTPNNVFGAGKQQDVPLIVGANGGDEARFFPTVKTIASGMNKVKSKAYVYVFTRVPPGWSKAGKAAIHHLQIYYLFGNLDRIDEWGRRNAQVASAEVDPVVDGRVSQDLMALWVRFAATGNPSIEGKISWPAYDPASEQYLDIRDPLQVKSGFSVFIK
jgi:para-nitrobenzyl esterase